MALNDILGDVRSVFYNGVGVLSAYNLVDKLALGNYNGAAFDGIVIAGVGLYYYVREIEKNELKTTSYLERSICYFGCVGNNNYVRLKGRKK